MKIVLAQVNATVGNIAKNLKNALYDYEEACNGGADIIVFPELSLSGYLIKDLAFSAEFLKDIEGALFKLAEATTEEKCSIIVGCPVLRDGKVYNAAVFIENGKIAKEIYKKHLPNYDVFEESRIFSSASEMNDCIMVNGRRIGILICEDLWHNDVAEHLLLDEAELLVAINASPFDIQKQHKRIKAIQNIYEITRLPILYLNRIGADDHIIFDGGSIAYANNQILYSKHWDETLIYFDFENELEAPNNSLIKDIDSTDYKLSNVYRALMIGTAEYLKKNGYSKVVIGLSGGIDSALVATLAVDILGSENVHCIGMPSRFSSASSIADAKLLANNLNCVLDFIGIDYLMDDFLYGLSNILKDKKRDVTEENIQARIRAILLMAVSNKNRVLLLSTSNKSESAVGYTTLYGDMSGGLAPIADVYKTQVYELVRWRNSNIPKSSQHQFKYLIPEEIINKSPSAELSYNQKDQDFLPPYEVLDKILHCLIEKEMECQEVVEKYKLDFTTVYQIYRLLIKSEFKRNQAPISLKISTKMLVYERRYPITLRR